MSDPTQNRPDAAERERARAAVELRVQGQPYAQIAAQLGYADESGARHAVSRLLARHEADSIDELRAVHSARLETVLSSFWAGMVSGNADAAKIVLRTLDSLAKLYGLDAPTRVALGPPVSDVEFANEAARLIERISELGATGELLEGLRATAVIDTDGQAALPERNGPGAQADSLGEADSLDGLDDLAGWSNIGDPTPAPAPVDPAAPIAPAMPEPEPLPDDLDGWSNIGDREPVPSASPSGVVAAPAPEPPTPSQPVQSPQTIVSSPARRIAERYDPLRGWSR